MSRSDEDAHRGGLLRRPLGVQRVHLALEVLEVLEALVDAARTGCRRSGRARGAVHRQLRRPATTGPPSAPSARSSASIASAARSRRRPAPGGASAPCEARRELVPVELLARAVALDDDQPRGLDALVGREPGLQAAHSRRRRIVAASSRSRESTTRVSASPHWGQRIRPPRHHYPLWCARGYHYMVWPIRSSRPLEPPRPGDRRVLRRGSIGRGRSACSAIALRAWRRFRSPRLSDVCASSSRLDAPSGPAGPQPVLDDAQRPPGTLELVDDRVPIGRPRRPGRRAPRASSA